MTVETALDLGPGVAADRAAAAAAPAGVAPVAAGAEVPLGAEGPGAEGPGAEGLDAEGPDAEAAEATGPRLPSLSPSRAADFKTCPLLFRFRTIDRLPEQPSPDQARGTLVHAVLERLF